MKKSGVDSTKVGDGSELNLPEMKAGVDSTKVGDGWLVGGWFYGCPIRRMILARQIRRGRQHPLLFHYHCDLRFIAQYVR